MTGVQVLDESGAAAPPSGLVEKLDGPAAEPKARPVWLRPAAVAAAVTLHAGAAVFLVGRVEPLSPVDAVEVTLLAQGDSAEDRQQIDEVKEAPPPAPQTAETAPERTAPAPKIVAPEAVPLPVAKPKPVLRPNKRDLAEQDDERPTSAERRSKTQAARLAAHRGAAQGEAKASGLSRASYASLLSAELNRRKVYPSAARAAGVTGSVGVAFTIGASGRVTGHSILNSSGDAALDGAVHAMMAAVHAPPPPGGSFSTSTTIRFHFQ